MGNSIGGERKKAKVMKVNGETFKLKTPIRAWDVIKDYPGHVLMDSMAVKHFGIRAQPLEPQQELKPKKIYFLVELPKFPDHEKAPRRVRSGINMTAKDRLECLMLSRRSISDLSVGKPSLGPMLPSQADNTLGPMQVKLRIPRVQLDKLVEESPDRANVAEKILHLYMMNSSHHQEPQGKPSLDRISKSIRDHQEERKRVSFNILEDQKPIIVPPLTGDIQLLAVVRPAVGLALAIGKVMYGGMGLMNAGPRLSITSESDTSELLGRLHTVATTVQDQV